MQTNYSGNQATSNIGEAPKLAIPADPLLRDKEAAAMLGASVSTFWRRVQDGVIPRPIKIGGMSRWKCSEIQAVIDNAAANREAA
ncbi:Helix-turn-helix domain protein [Roseivivax jejudonensis]|uniref:Helix-turn-helix domain protein n=1 Tax=Roseivivax jejudonensis TaxID=1529041 RepID=A0A1X7A6P5_9RHOB|nr:helix-turn-helix domain-containing protein [Roseivivax jejudonensis]SLN72073.1 Helix-turn-helix domain protein [Roseivivax jejudonensis]